MNIESAINKVRLATHLGRALIISRLLEPTSSDHHKHGLLSWRTIREPSGVHGENPGLSVGVTIEDDRKIAQLVEFYSDGRGQRVLASINYGRARLNH